MHASRTITNNFPGAYTSVFKAIRPLSTSPYKEPYTNSIYEMLFCDEASLYRNELSIPFYPWDVLFSPDTDTEMVKTVCQDADVDSRPKLIAYNLLSKAKADYHEKELLGVVIEIHQRNGLDVLTAYADGTARYIKHNETVVVCDEPLAAGKQLTSTLFEAAKELGDILPERHSKRKAYPEKGRVRISLLTSKGLCIKEGPFLKIRNDYTFGAVVETGIQFMLFLANVNNREARKSA